MQAPEVLGGRYELRGVLGRGGMAEVRDGWDIRLDRPVAVKLLHPVFTTQPDVRSIRDDVLSALATAHAAGVLHRDIKPANILFSPSGHAKVADFGIAKSAGSAHTMTGQIVGTMAYLSADRIAGRCATVGE